MQGVASPSPSGICTESSVAGVGGQPCGHLGKLPAWPAQRPSGETMGVTWGQREGWLLHGEWTVGAQGWTWDL